MPQAALLATYSSRLTTYYHSLRSPYQPPGMPAHRAYDLLRAGAHLHARLELGAPSPLELAQGLLRQLAASAGPQQPQQQQLQQLQQQQQQQQQQLLQQQAAREGGSGGAAAAAAAPASATVAAALAAVGQRAAAAALVAAAARPWSPDNAALFPDAARARAAMLVRAACLTTTMTIITTGAASPHLLGWLSWLLFPGCAAHPGPPGPRGSPAAKPPQITSHVPTLLVYPGAGGVGAGPPARRRHRARPV